MTDMSLSDGEVPEWLYEPPYIAMAADAKVGEELHVILPDAPTGEEGPIYIANLRVIVSETIRSCGGAGTTDADCAPGLARLAELFEQCAADLRNASQLPPPPA